MRGLDRQMNMRRIGMARIARRAKQGS
jgi:hypothetical protein